MYDEDIFYEIRKDGIYVLTNIGWIKAKKHEDWQQKAKALEAENLKLQIEINKLRQKLEA